MTSSSVLFLLRFLSELSSELDDVNALYGYTAGTSSSRTLMSSVARSLFRRCLAISVLAPCDLLCWVQTTRAEPGIPRGLHFRII